MIRTLKGALATLLTVAIAGAAAQAPKVKTEERVKPKFNPVAETKLLMEGLALPNYQGVENLLKKKPADDEAWVFGRGQALLIAETGNLLLIRPPRGGEGQDAWFRNAMALRAAAAALARTAANRDYDGSRAAFADLTATCNRCHTTFRVPLRLPFAEPPSPPK